MTDFFMSIATVFGGVLGGAIGFLFIVAVGGFLILPYLVMPHQHREPSTTDKFAAPESYESGL